VGPAGPTGAEGPQGPVGPEGPVSTELACPAGFVAQEIVFNSPGGQVTLFTCVSA
jgi:hypothetical protein